MKNAASAERRDLEEEVAHLRAALEEARHQAATLGTELAARISKLQETETRLRDSEERLHLAQRYSGAGTWDWDVRADRFSWSEEYCDLYGLDPRTAQPSYASWMASILPEDRAAAEAAVQDCLRSRAPDFRTEFRIQHPRRGLRWLTGRGRLVCDDQGEPIRLIGLHIDITDRKRAQAVLEENGRDPQRQMEEAKAREVAQARLFQTLKLEALGELTGGVAHDFNNLLSVITSGATLLRGTKDEAKRERLLDAIAQAARRGAELTRRLLTFARRQALHPEPIDLRAWLGDMQELLTRTLRGDITIEIAMPDDIWPVHADPAELELAVLNIAVNARDAMPTGGNLRIQATNVMLDGLTDPEMLDGEFVRLTLSDTGPGMAPEVLTRAFEPFFSTKPTGRGTGLGLAQVYGFARQTGGSARLHSAPGEGTTVTLLLPRAAEAPVATPRPAEAEPPLEQGRLQVLLVEDDDDVAALTTDMLRHLGHEVARVATARAALAALSEGFAADVVLTDVVMPGGQDGLDLARRIARQRPDLPVLLYSGFGGAPARVAAAGLPLLRKPFGLDELRRALAMVRAQGR